MPEVKFNFRTHSVTHVFYVDLQMNQSDFLEHVYRIGLALLYFLNHKLSS